MGVPAARARGVSSISSSVASHKHNNVFCNKMKNKNRGKQILCMRVDIASGVSLARNLNHKIVGSTTDDYII
jgi:hypothetical protein